MAQIAAPYGYNMQPTSADLRLQFVTFATVGLIGTAVHYAILLFGVKFASLPASFASSIGFVGGAVTNYFLNYFFTFASTGDHFSTGRRFVALVISGWLLNLSLMTLFAQICEWHYLLSQVFTTLVCLLWNFFGSRLWAFREV